MRTLIYIQFSIFSEENTSLHYDQCFHSLESLRPTFIYISYTYKL